MPGALIFVYGTLRKAYRTASHSLHPMHTRLLRYGHFVDNATCSGRLYDLGTYPGLLPPLHGNDRVHGEVYRLLCATPALKLLDEYEGFQRGISNSEYIRKRVLVTLSRGNKARAWIYIYNKPVRESQRILSGDYCMQLPPAMDLNQP